MKRKLMCSLVVVALCSCQGRNDTPAAAYQQFGDRLIVGLGLTNLGIWPCGQKEIKPAEQCYKLDPPKRWQGVWVTEFEGERFCPGSAQPCAYEAKPSFGLEWNQHTFPGRPQVHADVDKSYMVDFVGRRVRYRGSYNLRDYIIVVDRLDSMRELKRPTKK